VRAVVAQPAVR